MDKRDIEYMIKRADGETKHFVQSFSIEEMARKTYNTLLNYASTNAKTLSNIKLKDMENETILENGDHLGPDKRWQVRGIINFKENN